MQVNKCRNKFLVSKVTATKDVKASIKKAVGLIAGFSKYVSKGDTVLIKPNYNSDDPYPATSDPDALKALAELIYEAGAKKVIIGESSGILWKPTRKVLEKMGVTWAAKESGSQLINFDEGEWVEKRIDGKCLSKVKVPKILGEVDKLIYFPCLKTHRNDKFTMSLKLSVGMMSNLERVPLHLFNLECKTAELNVLFKPALIVMDARKCFVTGGPTNGKVEEPGLIMASNDRIAIDVEGIKILQSYKAKNKLKGNPWELPTIKMAVELDIGSRNEQDYIVIESK